MLVLALDTTTRQGSAALVRDAVLLGTYAGDAAITHGERLPGDLVLVLDAHGLRVADVDLFAVASGPGSFTGLRIGIATMQGLALANSKPLVGISALDAINDVARSVFRVLPSALSAGAKEGHVAVWMDAQRGQVFSAKYRDDVAVEAARVDKPSAILADWVREHACPNVFAGDGALAYRELIRAADPGARIVEPVPPLAPSVAALAEARVRQHGAPAPDAIRPIYVRRSDAELARDRKADLQVGPAATRSRADR
jgi:tRNA threonylcarbamoyladenosine biosynthesis protein TsaB